ncbi:MAG: hypothetical protein Q4B64_00400 [Spirochaetales bacterium]|nr:hypothetical protein [Spirochaetales bacterium]
MMKKVFFCLSAFVSLLWISSCDIGLGKEVDLVAPEVTVTSPETLSNVHKQFVMKGTCSDNVGVTSIDITDKESGAVYAHGMISGNTWQANLNLEEGEKTIVVSANDAAGNHSTKSIKTLIYIVDETAPEGLSWYVDRGNNVQTPLKDKAVLENLNYDDFTTIDIPQNESFKVYGRFYDAMSINTITLGLYEDGTMVAEKTVAAETITPGSSIYSPCFEFDASDLPTLTTGKHYLKLKYYSKDDHRNEATRELPYMLWWPESDNPRIGLQELKEDGSIRVNIGSAIPVHFFDDDMLKEVRVVLVGDADEDAVKANPDSVSWEDDYKWSNLDSQSKRDAPVQIYAPNLPSQKKLVTYAKDIRDKETVKVVSVEVTDAAKPLLFIESPNDNAIPDIKAGTNSKFEIKGYALDTTGCRDIKIAYVPGKTGSAAEARGKKLLKGATAANGEFVKTYSLGDKTVDSGWQKQTFTFTFDLLSDFKNGTTSYAREDKFFEMLLIDEDNNEVYRQLVLSGDKTAPKITVKDPPEDMWVYDYGDHGTATLNIKFSASKDSGLGFNEEDYKVQVKWYEANIDVYKKNPGANEKALSFVTEGGVDYAYVNIPRADIVAKKDINVQPTIIFEVTDVLGNTGVDKRNVVLSILPQLKSIGSGNMNGTFKKGDEIKFQAVFSDAVKVEGYPKLRIKYSADDTVAKYAEYNGTGNRTDTLVFTYTVPEGAESNKLLIDNNNAIVLGDGAITEISIKTANAGEGAAYLTTLTAANTLAGKEFKLDGKLPVIESITVVPENSSILVNADGNYYLKADEIIKATVKFSEKVNISGNPQLKLFGGTAGTTAITFDLQSINNDEITFVHKIVKGTTPEGALKYEFAKAFVKDSSGTNAGYVSAITDAAGNPLKLPAADNVENKKDNVKIIIDTTAPAAAPVIGIAGGATTKYNSAQTLTLTGESGATIEFSHNGGVSWNTYTAPVTLTASGFTVSAGAVTVAGGEYTLKTRQTDKAGNVSPESSEVHFTINDTFPAITGLVISKADGKYPAGDTVKFVLTYADKIKAPDASSIVLTFTLGSGDGAVTRTVNVKPVTAAAGSDRFEFEYTVGNTDEGSGITVTKIDYSTASGKKPVDLYGNSPSVNSVAVSNTGVFAASKRNGITLDGKGPEITDYVPALSAVVANGNVVKLTFSENVEKESGLITLRRKSTSTEPWRIPPVMTEEEFNSVCSTLTKTEKEVLIKMDGDAPKMYVKNGQPLGPYRQITHGLEGGNGAAPDTKTKFVLDFNIGISTGSGYLADGTQVNVSDLRAVFEKAGYHKQEVEVTDASVVINSANKKVVTITFPKALADGREWELFIEPGAFRDGTGNSFGGLGYTVSGGTATMNANSTYSFWSDKVAKPWVRVDRYSHGFAAIEPVVTGTGETAKYSTVKIITANGTKYNASTVNAAKTAPAGYARVRIDCETPGADIYYGLGGGVTNTSTASETTNTVWTSSSSVTPTAPSGISVSTTNAGQKYTGYFVVGDGSLLTGRRDYVKAIGAKSSFANSDPGYEGVFKTVVTINNNGGQNSYFIKAEGGTGNGGMPGIAGFPLRDAEEGQGHDKTMYTTDRKTFYWQTYEIVSDWRLLNYNGNYSSAYYWCNYGYAHHLYKPALYNAYNNDNSANGSNNDYNVLTVANIK